MHREEFKDRYMRNIQVFEGVPLWDLLENKVALLTGAAKGIGAACAKTFANNKASKIFIVDLDLDSANKTAKEISELTRAECYINKS